MRRCRISVAIVALAVGPLGPACERDAPACQDSSSSGCEITCGAGSVTEDSATVSGIASADLLFQTAVRLRRRAATSADAIASVLERMAVELGLERNATPDAIRSALERRAQASTQAGLAIDHVEPRCELSAELVARRAAECDRNVDPRATSTCQGMCEPLPRDACRPAAEAVCIGIAPALACPGACDGSCRVALEPAPGPCDGVCRGVCSGACSELDDGGFCRGRCDGACQGTCDVPTSGAPCSGLCVGECTWSAPAEGCGVQARPQCRAANGESVECVGWCQGELVGPTTKPECAARASAEAALNADCRPPTLHLRYELAMALTSDATVRAELAAWLDGFEHDATALLTAVARAQIVSSAGTQLASALRGPVKAAFEAPDWDVDLKAYIGLGCALDEIPRAAAVVEQSVTGLEARIADARSILEALDDR